MGNCSTLPKYRVVKAKTLFSKTKSYKHSASCKIKVRNPHKKITNITDLTLTLHSPELVSSFKVQLLNNYIWTSSCVMPGLNLKYSSQEKSQDFCNVIYDDDTLFISLFDGYGKEGDKIAELCISESENYFFENISFCNVNKT